MFARIFNIFVYLRFFRIYIWLLRFLVNVETSDLGYTHQLPYYWCSWQCCLHSDPSRLRRKPGNARQVLMVDFDGLRPQSKPYPLPTCLGTSGQNVDLEIAKRRPEITNHLWGKSCTVYFDFSWESDLEDDTDVRAMRLALAAVMKF